MDESPGVATLHTAIVLLYLCSHTTIHVSSYTCVLILLYTAMDERPGVATPHTAVCVLILLCMCPHNTVCVSPRRF
jgi:hypothetical protein